MLVDSRPTVQFSPLVPAQRETISDVPAMPLPAGASIRSAAEPAHVGTLRMLAGDGQLAATAKAASPAGRVALSGATFSVAWPVVFARLTRGLELRRGHHACAASVFRMEEDCLDRFYDDVEAVIDDVLAHASSPIRNLEAWIASRLTAATVDAHRRRRGQLGALQRPRLPKWLSELLVGDPWLTELAIQILIWVGVGATAGTELWPLDGWTARRAAVTADPVGSEPATVAREVEQVLTAMRTREVWFADHVERPFGHKRAPVVNAHGTMELPPLVFTERADIDDTHLAALASAALAAITAGLGDGQDTRSLVTDVIRTAFGTDTGAKDLDAVPFIAPDYDARVAAALGDPARVDHIVSAVLRIIG